MNYIKTKAPDSPSLSLTSTGCSSLIPKFSGRKKCRIFGGADPFMKSDMRVTGYIMDSVTGALEVV